MFELCLFDLDDTLVRTSDLENVRLAGKNNASADYLTGLDQALGNVSQRLIYSEDLLRQIRAAHPGMSLGVFTRSPRSYATYVLSKAYPNFAWDTLVAYEDVEHTKPRGHGVYVAMRHVNVSDVTRVVLVGDNNVDVCAAYHAGCTAVVDKSAWPITNTRDHWDALSHVPDAFLRSPADLLDVLATPSRHLPELERLLAGGPAGPAIRFDEIGHFKPWGFPGPGGRTPISVCGRSFSNHRSVERRRAGHALTASIEANKTSTRFPDEWVQAVLAFIRRRYGVLMWTGSLVVTVIPHRPERQPRLEHFLAQLGAEMHRLGHMARNVSVQPALLAYRQGVRSQHNEYLNAQQRCENVRDHLFVNRPDLVNGTTRYLVIDDVATTGASLIYANEYLRAAGARDVACLAIAKNVGNLFW